MENILLEISKIISLPNYTLLLDEDNMINIICFSKKISDTEIKMIENIFRNVFGIVDK